ncbi:MAG: amino acid permease [Chitinophagia bacterium]|jgi:APA family basic amino acid/polyamine antiporter|nr:amino acid permease [Chitinophagia bacterium]
MSTNETAEFKPRLSALDATMIVAGGMIGSGIFIVSSSITRYVGSAGWLIAAWVITGFMTITAALSYGELSAMYPKAGGQYVYLQKAYNPLVAFLFGWSFFAVIQTATIAAVAVAFSKFTAYLIPAVGENNIIADLGFIKISAAQLLAIALIVFLTYTNTRGVKEGKLIQNTFTFTKLISLFGLTLVGFLFAKHSFWSENWTNAFDAKQAIASSLADGSVTHTWVPVGGTALIGLMAAAMVGSIFSSDSWNNVTFIAGEIKNPQRNIGLSLFLGTSIVTLIYMSTNLMYLHVLPLNDIAFAENDRVAITAANAVMGNIGTIVIAVMIMISTFGCNNGLILAGSRVYYTMAKDGLFFKKAGTLNKNEVPAYGLWIQCLVAAVLCLSGKYGDLLTMVSFIVVIFYVLTIIGIFILRKKEPNTPRPYKAFGYPFMPAIYIVMATVFCIGLVYTEPKYSLWGLVITLLGIPLYYIALRNHKKD